MSSSEMPELYLRDRFQAKRQVLKLMGAAFRLHGHDGRLLAYSQQKAFKLKEDIRIYADESQSIELLNIKADRIIDFSACYQVYDSRTGEHYGSLRRKGWSSLWRDRWEILDDSGIVRGTVEELSGWKVVLRRLNEFFAFILPQTYIISVDGRPAGRMVQQFRWFAHEFEVDLTEDHDQLLPRPLAIAAVILMLAVEGRQG